MRTVGWLVGVAAWWVAGCSDGGAGVADELDAGGSQDPEHEVYCAVPGCPCFSDPRGRTDGVIGPEVPDELGQWAVARIALPPRDGPLLIDGVRFVLWGPVGTDAHGACDFRTGLRFVLLVDESQRPPVEPAPQDVYEVTIDEDRDLPWLGFSGSLEEPLMVGPSENLFVMLEADGTADAHNCFGVCQAPLEVAEESYWSFATEPPFDWRSFPSFGVPLALQVGVRGILVDDAP